MTSNLGVKPCSPKVHVIMAGAEDVWVSPGAKMMFLAQAVRCVKKTSGRYDRAYVAYFSPEDDTVGYSDEQETAFESAFSSIKIKGHPVKVEKVTSVSDMASKIKAYLQAQMTKACKSPGVIKQIDIFAHGSVGKIGFVFNGDPITHLTSLNVKFIKPEWFDEEANVYSWACQTMNSNKECKKAVKRLKPTPENHYNYETTMEVVSCPTLVRAQSSLGNSMAVKWGVIVHGYLRRTLYDKTWDTGLSGLYDDHFGDRILIDGKTKSGKKMQTVWEPSGADGGVRVGDSPSEVTSGRFTLTPP